MLKMLGAIAVLAALAAGCGSNEPAPRAAAPEPTATPHAEEQGHGFEKGHSRAVRTYYGGSGHGNADDVEAEYHQPPRPATGRIGDAITLTGTNIGVRLRATVDGVTDPATADRAPRAGTRYVGVDLRLRSTGIAILEDDLDKARLTYGDGRASAVLGVKAECSHGFDDFLLIDVGDRVRGCVLFEVPAGSRLRQFQLALEQVPAAAGGRWRLG